MENSDDDDDSCLRQTIHDGIERARRIIDEAKARLDPLAEVRSVEAEPQEQETAPQIA